MVSTPTTRNRFNKQGTGDNQNTWGTIWNTQVADLIDEALDGYVAITVNGNVTLTSTNYVSDQARMRQLWLSGAGGYTVTIPGVQKFYLVRNACTAAVTFTAGGVTCSVPASQSRLVFTNGTDCYVSDDGASLAYVNATFLPLTGGTLTGSLTLPGNASNVLHAVPLQQMNAAILASTLGYPALVSNSLKFLRVNAAETAIEWGTVDLSSVEPLLTYAQTSGNVNPAVVNTHYGVDSTTAARTITLPASASGRIIVSDRDGNAATNNITIARNGNTIASAASDYIIDTNRGWVELIGASGDWKMARGR